ncbi:head closure protein [Geobacillus phage GR1]|nr:head closure protein [Geobacillus phage GR1]
MNPGKLNKRVEIMELGQVSDGGGGYEDAFIPIKKVWANIRPVYGREKWQAQQAQAEISHKVIIRYTDAINRSHILSFNGKKYDIQYIINIDESNRFLEIQVLERQ